jgi:hypothetical protein
MTAFLNYPGYRNVFSCIQCEMSRIGSEEIRCEECHSYACKHLIADAFGATVCFCCVGDFVDREWPNWCFTMVPEKVFRGRNGK